MYEQFYGLSGLPFSLLPDSGFLFLSKRHRRALTVLEYGMLSQAGFVVLTGDVGAGKTTIIRRFLKNTGRDMTIGVITNTSRSMGTLMGWVASAFELDGLAGDAVAAYHGFVEFLVAHYAKGKRAVLIIDEAQNLDPGQLEDLRMLSNVNNEKDSLLQIVLVGQPELLDMLKRHDLRQFAQRIAVHCHLDPMTAQETRDYIRHRLDVVGATAPVFNDEACAAVYCLTGGVPRLINLLCDQAMVYGFSEDIKRITLGTILAVAEDRAKGGLSPFRNPFEGMDKTEIAQSVRAVLRDARGSGGGKARTKE